MNKQTIIVVSASDPDRLEKLAKDELQRFKNVEIINTNLFALQKKDYDRETVYLCITIKYTA